MILKRLFGRKKNRDDWDYADDVLGGESQPSSGIATADSQDHDLLNGIKARVKAYADYNARKISTIISKLGDLDKEIFTVLPALVHLNLPGLPGFISNRELAPDGIMFFKISNELPNLIKSLFPKAKIPTRNFVRPKGKSPIYSLAAMGSLGTIAQTAKSDLDIWVCVKKPEFTKEQLDALAHKLQEIEKWAEKKNHFECHFFITDIDEARENHFGESDSESAGSALGKLLKEEFYRTHTVLAGLPPLWTVMPPHISDEEYERLSRMAPERYAYDPAKYIDLGNAQRVSMEEAFGAALWQLNKALRSPFKSAIKMALIENYMDPHSEPTLLCDNLKENLTNLTTQFYKDKFKTDALGPGKFVDDHPNHFELDGYLLMFNRILEYYRRKGREDLQEILRQCFYLKAGDTITGIYDPMRQKNLKKDMLGELIEGWGWNNDHILDLNAFKEWPFERSVELGRQINNFIVDSYKRLSQSGTTSNVKINENDLTVLGRKLFTFYSRKDKKVEYLPKSFEESLHQDQITFSMIPTRRGGEGIWRVHRGSVAA
ncbi:MAG: class I adenylate cyclase, partial [bacterium]